MGFCTFAIAKIAKSFYLCLILEKIICAFRKIIIYARRGTKTSDLTAFQLYSYSRTGSGTDDTVPVLDGP
jgi:hypothetical protein